MAEIKELCVSLDSTVRRVLECIDQNKMGVALVVDEAGVLCGTITDGDVRRFLLAQRSLDEKAESLAWKHPVTARQGTGLDRLMELIQRHKVRLIPLVDENNRPVSVFSHRQFLFSEDNGRFAVIMAGGEGKRLRPLTEEVPKPMLKVGDAPVLEKIIQRLAGSGYRRIFLSVNYKAHIIENYFEDGSRFGVEIDYLHEDEKLGTAGPLSLLPKVPTSPLLVINGDVLTSTDFNSLYEYHVEHRAVMTVASIQYKVQVPYGALRLAGHYLLGVDEKPQQVFHCNAGIYVINPELLRLVPKGEPHDMTDLLDEVLGQGLPVCTFPLHEYWLDIGQMPDLEKARLECAGQVPARNGDK